MSSPGRFIVIEGGDGVGKTTLARQLGDVQYDEAAAPLSTVDGLEAADRRPLVFVPRRQISRTSAYAANLMEHIATSLWHSGDSTDLPDSFWVHLQASWFVAHASTVLTPLLDAGYDVLVDGWLYKFWSKLLLQGYRRAELDIIFDRVRKPDRVVLLEADAGALYDRRERQFRARELGMHAGYRELTRATFIDYQEKGLRHLRALADEFGWATLTVEDGEPVGDTVARLRPIINGICSSRLVGLP
jgi:thymidylate kinase